MNKRVVSRWLKVFIIIYCLLGIVMYYVQDYLILLPTPLPAHYQYNFDLPNREVNVPYNKETNINIIQFQTGAVKTKGVILYFHGNRKNISRYRRFVPYFTKSGYEVWMIDYPGYGKSTGKFSEKLVYEWSLIMYNLARKTYTPQEIVIFGKSLGTGIAAQLASIRNCRYLILESPYYSMPAVFGYYAPIYPVNQMIHHQFPTYSFLPQVTDPIIIFHGTDDGVIPYRHSKKLQALLKKGDKLVTLEGGTHRNLFTFPAVPRVIDSLLSK
jgi:alpha-beta hydrolase superfamily lysophospholipase